MDQSQYMLEDLTQAIIQNSTKKLEELSLRQKYVLYRVSSCLYYHHNKSLFSDTYYDSLCKNLLDNYDSEIIHVDKELLKAGTGYSLSYGTTTHNICNTLIRQGVV